MTGIESYSTTASNNVQANTGINWDEGMPPAAVNNSARQNMADMRAAFNDLAWFQYGAGAGLPQPHYASATSFTQVAAADLSAVYHVGRRVKAVGVSTGTIYGSINTTSWGSGTQTVSVTWDSGSLANESYPNLMIYLSQTPVTGSPVGANPALNSTIQIQAGNYAAATGTNSYAITLSPAPASYSALVGVPLKVLFTNGQTINNLTLNVNGLGAKSIVRVGESGALTMFYADVLSGSIHELVFDGTNFQMIDLNALAVMGSGTARTTSVPNTNTPTTIFGAVAATCIIYCDLGSGSAFSDLVTFYQGTSSVTVHQSSEGSPGTRTYSMSGPFLQMALSGASGAAAVSPIILHSYEPSP